MLPKVMRYMMCFENLTLEKQKREPYLYERLLILKVLQEFDKRYFYPAEIYKPSKKGTCVIFKNIFDKDNINLAEKNINELILSFNEKYQKDLVLLKIRNEVKPC